MKPIALPLSCDTAQNKNIPAYTGQWASANVWVRLVNQAYRMSIKQKIMQGWGSTQH